MSKRIRQSVALGRVIADQSLEQVFELIRKIATFSCPKRLKHAVVSDVVVIIISAKLQTIFNWVEGKVSCYQRKGEDSKCKHIDLLTIVLIENFWRRVTWCAF